MGVAAVTAVSSFPHEKVWAAEALYPPMDLSYFDTPISPGPSDIHFGYAAITWGGNDRQAIADIAALGFHGIQLRANVIKEFGSAAELRNLLEKHQLKMVALSSGGVRVDAALEAEEIAKHTANAKFVHDVGGLYLQVTDERPKDRAITAADHLKSQRVRGKLREAYARLFEKFDAVCTPALGFLAAVATPLEADLETLLAGDDPFGSAGNLLGLPSIALPGPLAHGLPTAMQLLGPPWSEELLCAIAAALEQVTPWANARPPRAS